LPSFGEKLKLEREKRSITLEQISLSTKIGTRMLRALEEEKFDQLPGGIFNKGFVRSYARHLGLDEDQAVADYLEASGEGPAPKTGPAMDLEAAPAETREATSSRQLPWGLFAALLLLLALALSLWSRRQHRHEGQTPKSPPAPTATQKPVADSSAASVAAVPPAVSTAESANPLPTSAPVKPDASPSTVPIPTAAVEKNAAPVAAVVTPPTSAPSPGEFVVVILAHEDSWLSITADGKTIVNDALAAGTQRTVHGRKEVVVRAGNVGGVDFVFNGKKLDPQGEHGEVRTLTFGSGGLQPNRPALPAVQ
jgi:cytoskeleton protein RodZ